MALRLRHPLSTERRDDVARLTAEFEALRQADSHRLSLFKDYREEVNSARFSSIYAGAESSDYGQHVDYKNKPPRHNLPLPLAKALNVKHSHRIAGLLPDAIVDARDPSPIERYRSETMEKMWWSTLHASGGDTVISSGAWDASEVGSACFYVYWDVDEQKALIQSVDPAGILAVPGVDNPHRFQRVYRFWSRPLESVRAEYRNMSLDHQPVMVDELYSTHTFGEVDMCTLVECDDGKRKVRFALGGSDFDSVPLLELSPNLGFVPYVVIPNIGPEREVWGWADYEFVRALCRYIPVMLGREADVLRAITGGAYKEEGTGQDPDEINRIIANGGVLPSRRDSKVEPIKAPEMPDFADRHAEQVMDLFKMLGFAPDASWGGGDTRSGTDRGLQLMPQRELTAHKQTNWSQGLSRLASYVFRMTEKMQVGASTYRGSRPGTAPRSRDAFSPFQLGPNLDPVVKQVETSDGDVDELELPRNVKDLFGGDYSMRFVWQNRIDPDDPAFVLSEINKFVQGVQSLETTLDRLGFQAPEDEIRRIEDEAERLPWLRQGMIALTIAALRQQEGQGPGQGAGGGAPTDVAGGVLDALGMMGTKDGDAQAANAMSSAIPGATGKLYGG